MPPPTYHPRFPVKSPTASWSQLATTLRNQMGCWTEGGRMKGGCIPSPVVGARGRRCRSGSGPSPPSTGSAQVSGGCQGATALGQRAESDARGGGDGNRTRSYIKVRAIGVYDVGEYHAKCQRGEVCCYATGVVLRGRCTTATATVVRMTRYLSQAKLSPLRVEDVRFCLRDTRFIQYYL